MNLSAIDLNLLVTLEALLEERNVTRAARRVGVTQPAMSNALRRLRELLDDPVMVRTPEGMAPTPRAEALAGDLRAGLAALRLVVDPPTRFNPKTATRRFTIVCTDYDELVVLPGLIERLAARAPGITISAQKYAGGLPRELLLRGAVDLFVGHWPSPPAPLQRERLFVETMSTLVRRGHPRVRKRLTRKQFVELPHILVAPLGDSDRGLVDDVLAERGETRSVVVTTANFLMAPVLVARTDYLCTITTTVARHAAAGLGVRVLLPPIELPSFGFYMVWNARFAADPAHEFLREMVRTVTSADRDREAPRQRR